MCCVKLQSFIQSCLWLECNGSVWKKQKGACTTVVAIVKCLGLILWWGAQQMFLLNNNKNPYSVLCGQTGPCCKVWVMVLFYVCLVGCVCLFYDLWLAARQCVSSSTRGCFYYGSYIFVWVWLVTNEWTNIHSLCLVRIKFLCLIRTENQSDFHLWFDQLCFDLVLPDKLTHVSFCCTWVKYGYWYIFIIDYFDCICCWLSYVQNCKPNVLLVACWLDFCPG